MGDALAACVERKSGQPMGNTYDIADISRGLGSRTMVNMSPCVTPSSCLWVFNRWRWMIGCEMLALQGFPMEKLNPDGLSNSEMMVLAGNAMSVPVVGAFLFVVLALVSFPPDKDASPAFKSDGKRLFPRGIPMKAKWPNTL